MPFRDAKMPFKITTVSPGNGAMTSYQHNAEEVVEDIEFLSLNTW
jgi:hypothetical protein